MQKIERQIIATILSEKDLIDDVFSEINKSHFTDDISRKAFGWISGKYKIGEKPTQVRMQTETDIELDKIIEAGTNIFEFEQLVEVLKEEKIRRNIMKTTKEIYIKAKNKENDISQVVADATEKIFKINYKPNKKEIYYNDELLDMIFDELVKIENGEEVSLGIPTGMMKLDALIGGLQRGHLMVIAASTSMGKTSLALRIALNLIKQDKRVLVNTLEMDSKEIMRKILSLDSRVPTSAYMNILSDIQGKSKDAAIERLLDKRLIVNEKRGITTNEIKATTRKIINKRGNIDLLIVDYLQLINMRDGDTREQKIGNAVLALRNLAGELDIPIILLSQFNRSRNGTPKMKYMRGSGRIEEIADEILLPYRPEFEEKENDKYLEEAKIIIDKGRTSGTGIIDMKFYPKIQYWQDGYEFENDGAIEIIEENP